MSRSGRIRKKSSKFADFESHDEIDGFYKKKNLSSKPVHKLQTPKVDESDSDDSDSDDSDSDIDMKEDSMGFSEDWGENVDPEDILDEFKVDDFDNDDSLHVDEDPSSASKEDSNYSQVGLSTNSAKSLYFSEKKKPSLKDSNTVKKKKSERKDKGKARFTAYMLWARATRPKIIEENPLMDFSAVNKRLGEMWALVPYTQKHNWKRKAKKLEAREEKSKQGKTMISTGKGSKGGIANKANLLNKGKLQTMYSNNNNRAGNKSHVKAQSVSQNPSSNTLKQSYQTPKSGKTSVNILSDSSPPTSFKVTGTSPIDVAAHLKLLGESLNNIGQKLKEHEGQIAVSGSLSVLLDSMLCVLGPLACLSNQLEETRGAISDQTLSGILDNIAYIMPGIV